MSRIRCGMCGGLLDNPRVLTICVACWMAWILKQPCRGDVNG